MKRNIPLEPFAFRATLSALIFLGLLLASCSSGEKKETPITGFSSCIAIDLPPITLTPSRTAAERQLIGENVEIEKNGWLIASARSVHTLPGNQASGKSEESGPEDPLRQYYREMSVLDFYRDVLDRLKTDGILGESDQGKVLPVPESISPRIGKYRNPGEVDHALRIAKEVNRSRESVFRYLQKKEGDPDLRKRFLQQTRKGEWIHTNESGWRRVE